MTPLRFTVPGPAVGKGRPRAYSRGGHASVYTPRKTLAYEDRVALYAVEAARGATPIEGPVRVEIVALRKRPKKPGPKHECRVGVSIVVRPASTLWYRIVCTAKPDADNLAKTILDGSTLAGVWRDDSQVAELRVFKVWCAEDELPAVHVAVWPL